MNESGISRVRVPILETKENYLQGFWQWVALMDKDDYVQAAKAIHWPRGSLHKPDVLKDRVTTFFGGDDPWSVVVPNDRLIQVINDAAEFAPRNEEGWGWLMAQIPLTTEPEDPKNDEIPLMGLAVSFFFREYDGAYEMEFEIFHL